MNKLIFEKDIHAICENIFTNKSFILIPHISIDGDDLGCMLTLYEALLKLKKEVFLYSPDSVPENLKFLQGIENLKNEIPFKKFDTAVFLECSNTERIPSKVNIKSIAKTTISIDHHPDNKMFAKLNWINSTASALGEIIYELLNKLSIKLTNTMAENLYVAILTDTGGFKYLNTTSRTHEIIAELMKNKINIAEIYQKIYEEKSINILKLLGRVLYNIREKPEIKTIWSIITMNMMKEENVNEEDTQIIIEEIKKAKNFEFYILFKEMDRNTVKVSMRSNNFPINILALKYKGGGHQRAAGCTINDTLENAQKLILSDLYDLFLQKGF